MGCVKGLAIVETNQAKIEFLLALDVSLRRGGITTYLAPTSAPTM
jgi:hypothetical protein